MIPATPDDTPRPPTDKDPPDDPAAPRMVRSEDLFVGRRELLIQHGESIYRLRITAQGRLILMK